MDTYTLQHEPTLTRQAWRMLGWLLAVQVLMAFVGRSISPLGILIGEDLFLTKAQIGMLPSALFFGQMCVSIPAGFLVDRIGSKRLLLMVSVCLGISFMLMTFTSFFFIVLIMIAIGGLGYGAMHPASNRGIIYWFTPRKRGTAMGIKQMGVTLGSALSALLLLPLADRWGWRPVLSGACLLLIAIGILAYFIYHDPPSKKENEPSKETSRFFVSILNMSKHKPLLFVSLGATGLQAGQMILNTYIVLFAYEKLEMILFLSGVLLVISEVGASFGRVGWGVISDRLFHGRRLIILLIIALLAASISFLIAFLPAGTPFWLMAPITFLFGFSVSGFHGIWMNVATELVPREQAGTASGFSIMLGSWGVIVGPPLFGLIVDGTGAFAFGWGFLTAILIFVMICMIAAMTIIKRSNQAA